MVAYSIYTKLYYISYLFKFQFITVAYLNLREVVKIFVSKNNRLPGDLTSL